MIHRYTLPEQLSSSRTLQLKTAPDINKQAFSQWIELHPSRLLPAYAIQSVLSMGQELQSYAHARLPQIYYCEADPKAIFDQELLQWENLLEQICFGQLQLSLGTC